MKARRVIITIEVDTDAKASELKNYCRILLIAGRTATVKQVQVNVVQKPGTAKDR